MNKKLFIFFMLFGIFGYEDSVSATVIEKTVEEGKTVEKTVFLRPGFGTLIRFPETVISAVLAEKSLFSCEKFPDHLVCVTSCRDNSESNLNVQTPRNYYILTLSCKQNVPYDGVSFRYESLPYRLEPREENRFLKSFLKNFEVKKINKSASNDAFRFSIRRAIYFDDSLFIEMNVENGSPEALTIKDVEVVMTARANLTGLPIRSVKIPRAGFKFRKSVLAPNEMTGGFTAIKRIDTGEKTELLFKLIAQGKEMFEVVVENVRLEM